MKPRRSPTVDVEHLRAAADAEVRRTSLRAVARAVGLSPTGLRAFILGGEPYAHTVEKLRLWYVATAREREGLNEETGREAVALLVSMLPPSKRAAAERRMLDALREAYREAGEKPPGWTEG